MDVTNKFTNAYNNLVDFHELQASSTAEDNVHSLEALRIHLDHIWSHVKRCYEECRDYEPKESDPPIELKKLRATYRNAITTYKVTLGTINAEIDVLTNKASKTLEKNIL